MAEDTRADAKLTLAELCEAIAEGRLQYTIRDGCYQVKPTDARRLRLDLDDPLLDLSPHPEAFDTFDTYEEGMGAR